VPTRIYLVRHGQTYGNIEGRFCGHSETELTPLGIAQARAAGRRLADVAFDAAYASDLSRAAETAHYILEGRAGLAASHDQALREMHYGEWEARPYAELMKEAPEAVKRFLTGREECAPGGETLAQLRERTATVARRLAAAHPDGNVLVVSHGNAIMAMLAELLGVPLAATWSFVVDNTSVSELHFTNSGRFMLKSFNDAAHTAGVATLDS
jgi:broad specificity phosphatase PhoE